ncbi:MAG: M20/M25/M40 family metallo-hydrolase [Chloroflexi bacterium]|nr:M20/M25/M40 family metallo-hydrolase [Chloroflexota bacterium]
MNDVDRIARAIDERQDELVRLTQEMIRIPTPNPPGLNYDRMAEFLMPFFPAMGFQVERIDMPNDVFQERCKGVNPLQEGPRANVLATMDVGAKENALWYAHTDVVPVVESEWSVPAYEGIVRDGRIWGRGSADDKGPVAAIITAFRVLRELGISPAYNVTIALTPDEEGGPYSGLMYLADIGRLSHCQYFMALDGSHEGVSLGNNGQLTWTVMVRGKSIHSARADEGVNAIEHGYEVLRELVALKAEVRKRRSSIPASPLTAKDSGIEVLAPNLNVTIAHGGTKHNIIPAAFVLEGDRRVIPGEEMETAALEIEDAVARARRSDPALDCELAVNTIYIPFYGDPEHPWVRKVQRAVEIATGQPCPLFASSGSTDVGHAVKVTGMAHATYGVAQHRESRGHGPDENCRISNLLEAARVIALVAAGLT